jgi:uncharacterized protein (TIGR01777 family)
MTSPTLRGPSGPSHIVVSGAGGLIGRSLTRRLTNDGHRVTRLVRRPAGPGEISWDPGRGVLDPTALGGIDAVIHLSGENVGARWTEERKQAIRSSRSKSTRLLSETLAFIERPPAVMISASAVGIYGDRGDEVLTESSAAGDPERDFLVSVTQEWERAAEPARAAGIRVAHPRFGVVLSPAGGALAKMLPPFRLGLGGRLGSGRQWMSWVAIDDAIEAVCEMLIEPRLQGAINVTAPEPATNRDFTRTLGKVLSRPAIFPVPETALRISLGEMAMGTILSSARALPAKLLDTGFRFRYPNLESALRHVLAEQSGDSFPG